MVNWKNYRYARVTECVMLCMYSRCQHLIDDYIDGIEYSSRFLQEKEKKNKIEEVNEAQAKFKRQMFGNIKFIGELFKLKVSSSAFVTVRQSSL